MDQPDGLKYARETVGGDPVARDLGITVQEVARERAVLALVPRARHLNSLGRVHGASIYALIDLATAVAANTGRQRALVAEVKVNYLAAAEAGERLVAEAAPVSRGRRLSLWEVRVRQGDLLVALAQALTYHSQRQGS